MKQSFILGGFVGFALCLASALMAGSDAETALRDAIFCALISAMLFRWLHAACTNQLHVLLRERVDAAAAAGHTAPAGAAPGPTTQTPATV